MRRIKKKAVSCQLWSNSLQKCFTLIELLVVISIIGVVIGLIAGIGKTIRNENQDFTRVSDLYSLRSALENYYADQGFYPTSREQNSSDPDGLALESMAEAGAPLTNRVGDGGVNSSNPLKTYLNKIPRDPFDLTASVNEPHYCYASYHSKLDFTTPCNNDPGPSGVKCMYYGIFADMETPTGVNMLYFNLDDSSDTTVDVGENWLDRRPVCTNHNTYNFEVNPP